MSKENVKLFFEKLQSDQELQGKLKQLFAENQEKSLEKLVQLGAEAGCEFSIDDLQQLQEEVQGTMLQQGELDESQLEAVAGGGTADWVVMSIFSFGLGCLVSGVVKAHSKECSLDTGEYYNKVDVERLPRL